MGDQRGRHGGAGSRRAAGQWRRQLCADELGHADGPNGNDGALRFVGERHDTEPFRDELPEHGQQQIQLRERLALQRPDDGAGWRLIAHKDARKGRAPAAASALPFLGTGAWRIRLNGVGIALLASVPQRVRIAVTQRAEHVAVRSPA